jgi:hypothetical protein
MKTYEVKLVRQVPQIATVRVQADDSIDAVDNAIQLGKFATFPSSGWQQDMAKGDPDVFYQEVKEVPEEVVEPEPDPKGEEKNVTTKIYTYDVELDVSYDGDDLVSSCFISKTRDGTLYCSSLALLSDVGTIEGDNWGDVIEVPEKIITKIHHWAEENGY